MQSAQVAIVITGCQSRFGSPYEEVSSPMRRSRTEIYLHVVWSTRLREPHLTPSLAPVVRGWITAEAEALGCDVLALHGMPDHLHLLVRTPARVAVAQLVKQVKGVSSREANTTIADGFGFRWQEGYGAFSVSRSHVPRVLAYVQTQPERHARGDVWPDWEQTDEEAPG